MPAPLPSLPIGLGLSVIAHVGLVAVAVRGTAPAARPVPSADAIESRVEIEVAEPLAIEASDPAIEEVVRPAVRSSLARRHRHAYAVPSDHDAVPHDPRVVHDRAASAPPSEPATAALPADSDAAVSPPALRFTLTAVGRAAPLRARAGVGAAAPGATSGLPAAAASAPAGAGDDEAGAEGVFPEGRVTSRARLVFSVPPVYPAAASRSGIESDVPLEIVVDEAGRVTSAVGLGRAGFGLDQAARDAVARYRFSPALREGRPVRVRMRWTVQFRLR
ncbi:MAG TPA: energy transducer TonB [Polyangia bacterium]